MQDIIPTITKAGRVRILTFPASDVSFATMRAAEKYLDERGFSVGPPQGAHPRGIVFGDFEVQKWRNLSGYDRDRLHGTMDGDSRHGPLLVRVFDLAPDDAHIAICLAQPCDAEAST